MLNHGTKISEDLYLCIYDINLKTYKELEKLVISGFAIFPFLKNFDITAKALGYTKSNEAFEYIKKNVKKEDLQTKYSSGGAQALCEIFSNFDRKVRSCYMSEEDSFLICFSNKKLNKEFKFEKDAANIEMMIGVFTFDSLDYVIHIGIQRMICYAAKGHPYHQNLAMLLHGCAAKFVSQRYNNTKKFMVTNPLHQMSKIFHKNLPYKDMMTIENRFLGNVREALNINKPGDHDVLSILDIEYMQEDSHTAVSLDALLKFSKDPISETDINHTFQEALNGIITKINTAHIILGCLAILIPTFFILSNTEKENQNKHLTVKM